MATNYKAAFFKHWLNLTFLAATAAAAFAVDWKLGVAGLLVEGATLWVVPEFKSVQKALDASQKASKIDSQRCYYIKMLWNIEIERGNALFRNTIDWTEVVSEGRGNDEYRNAFNRMVRIVESLKELQKMHPDTISSNEMVRMDEWINRWLELQYQVRNISDTLRLIDRSSLAQELQRLEQMARTSGNDRAARIVLAERFRTLKRKAESIPKHERRKGLWMAQAESIVQHMEELNTNVRMAGISDAGFLMDFSAFDNLMGSGDDIFENAEASSEVRDMSLSGEFNLDDPEMWGNLRQQLGCAETLGRAPQAEVVEEVEEVGGGRRRRS